MVGIGNYNYVLPILAIVNFNALQMSYWWCYQLKIWSDDSQAYFLQNGGIKFFRLKLVLILVTVATIYYYRYYNTFIIIDKFKGSGCYSNCKFRYVYKYRANIYKLY